MSQDDVLYGYRLRPFALAGEIGARWRLVGRAYLVRGARPLAARRRTAAPAPLAFFLLPLAVVAPTPDRSRPASHGRAL